MQLQAHIDIDDLSCQLAMQATVTDWASDHYLVKATHLEATSLGLRDSSKLPMTTKDSIAITTHLAATSLGSRNSSGRASVPPRL
jgi:hypothetical protein